MFPASKRDANFSLTSSGKVGSYFHDAFYALWNSGLLNDFRTALQEYPTAEVWVSWLDIGRFYFHVRCLDTLSVEAWPP